MPVVIMTIMWACLLGAAHQVVTPSATGAANQNGSPASPPPEGSEVMARSLTAFARKVDGYGKVRPSTELIASAPSAITAVKFQPAPSSAAFHLKQKANAISFVVDIPKAKPIELGELSWSGNELRFKWGTFFEGSAAEPLPALDEFLSGAVIELDCGKGRVIRVEPPCEMVSASVKPGEVMNHPFPTLSDSIMVSSTASDQWTVLTSSPTSVVLVDPAGWQVAVSYLGARRGMMVRVHSEATDELKSVRSDLRQTERMLKGASETEKKILESDLARLSALEKELASRASPPLLPGLVAKIDLTDEATSVIRASIQLSVQEN
ncbi:MAG: hypothetical protein EXS00_03940 [Phycisphaerales bacterium]|nr:hypothetical protein [Phycisphaerales bacterium]